MIVPAELLLLISTLQHCQWTCSIGEYRSKSRRGRGTHTPLSISGFNSATPWCSWAPLGGTSINPVLFHVVCLLFHCHLSVCNFTVFSYLLSLILRATTRIHSKRHHHCPLLPTSYARVPVLYVMSFSLSSTRVEDQWRMAAALCVP